MSQTIEVTQGESVVVIWLNRPEVHNALNEEMVEALTRAIHEASQRPELAAVVLASKGSSFCSGADLNWYPRAWQSLDKTAVMPAVALEKMLRAIEDCPVPVIARVHGHCVGVGIGLVAAADIAFASHEAEFTQAETRLGFIPHLVAPYLSRAMGPRAAGRWLMTGETFAASEAWRLGLVQEICEESEIDIRLNALLGHLMMTAPTALRQTRKLVRALSHSPPEGGGGRQAVAAPAADQVDHPAREGVAAFIDKRWPSWVPGELKS